MNLGGRNCKINLVSSSGNNKMAAIVGMALFTQYYYWFPMLHFINLAVEPVILLGVDSNLKIPKNFQVLSKEKPSVFGYPQEAKLEEKSQEKKIATAVLSTVGRAKAKSKRLGTSTSINAEMAIDDRSISNLAAGLDKEKAEKEKEEKEKADKEKEEKEKAVKIEEPNEEFLSNPIRILPKQKNVINFVQNQDYRVLLSNRFNGFVMLNRMNLGSEPVYFEEEVKKEEEKKDEESKTQGDKAAGEYQPVPTNDAEMPEEIDLNAVTKK